MNELELLSGTSSAGSSLEPQPGPPTTPKTPRVRQEDQPVVELGTEPIISPFAPISILPQSPIKIQHKFRLRSPSPATPTATHTRSRSATTRTDRTSTRGSLPERYPTPPPPEDPLGPAAQYPYLPDTSSEDGQPMYSCRIGGPKLYDILSTLSLDKFGVLAWSIVEREEELFELDDVRDEDKVMLALWNRWIMLNR